MNINICGHDNNSELILQTQSYFLELIATSDTNEHNLLKYCNTMQKILLLRM